MTPEKLAEKILVEAEKHHDYNTICEGCVEMMLEARLTFCETADYGISGAQAAMIGQEVARRMS